MRQVSLLFLMVAVSCGPDTIPARADSSLSFPPRGDTVGIVLFVHGCDGLGGNELFPPYREWVRMLRERGFLVVAQNSYAEERPPMECVQPFTNKGRIYEIRHRQTRDAIAAIRRAHPGHGLIMWGHSEGAGVVNSDSWAVNAIITTGYQCGFRGSRRVRIDSATPMLVIAGTQDSYITEVLRDVGARDLHEYCAPVLTSPRWKLVVIPGMGHVPPLSEPGVRAALDTFLDPFAARMRGTGGEARR